MISDGNNSAGWQAMLASFARPLKINFKVLLGYRIIQL